MEPTLDTVPPDSSPLTRGAPQWLTKIERPPAQGANRAPANSWPGFLAGQPEKPVRVLVIDEDAGARRAIAHELAMDARVRIVGEAGSLQEGKRLLTQHEFDVLIIDIRLGGGKGFELIESARRHCSSVEVIVHSALEDEVHVRRAFTAGAWGYLVKNSWFQDFAQAVLQVVNGGAAVSPSVIRHLLKRLGNASLALGEAEGGPRGVLSAREREVLRLVAEGHVTGDIARHLSISGRTVCAHMKNICHKLQVRTRAHAVIAAANQGLL
ncbi:DNA-binding response regulator, NarL/FixJ family, contains REC and HTH domains [Variovorax sp. YR752]|uniref:response regulator n=1 Tax=Variovorax sp. YR752 TaxID=1884383 RepID=UPI000BC6FBD2|nr:response regulator transcription factor [Variovorax sp. YR752]SOD28553.1 DNA-binding response regulator, NarL/FixJ family, contains REC and HTH domains [Variovorax sp. YR752]